MASRPWKNIYRSRMNSALQGANPREQFGEPEVTPLPPNLRKVFKKLELGPDLELLPIAKLLITKAKGCHW
jgi:hypothetical protein